MEDGSGMTTVADKGEGGRSLCRTPRCRGSAVALVAIVGVALAWWLSTDQGAPELPAQRASIMLPGVEQTVPPTAAVPMAQGGARQPLPGLDVMADKLAKRLAREPADGEGWALLARTYLELGKTAEADAAYARALELRPDDAAMKADYTAARQALKSSPH
jgi:cytochrome c-type biogenesis protein CcmH/NrfG